MHKLRGLPVRRGRDRELLTPRRVGGMEEGGSKEGEFQRKPGCGD